jgi:molybdate transport system ATP-binding protein
LLKVELKRKLLDFSLNVAFSVDGETLGILGPSGSGKTMTLLCIAGLIRPDSGFIQLNDRVLLDSSHKVNLPSKARNVGLVFQNYALFPHLTAGENIAYGIRNRSRQEVSQRVQVLIEKMGLDGLQQRYPRELSSGQQQRVAVARALAPEPEILLLDEPFSALDSLTKEQLEMQILDLRQFYKGNIILVTHDLAEAYRLSSRIAVYESGGIIQCDNKAKLIASPANLTVAKITGFRNLLLGTINEITDSHISILVPELGTLKAVRYKHSRLLSGMSVTIGISPEYVKITNHPGENTVYGSLSRIVEEIRGYRCFFQLNSAQNTVYQLDAVISKSDKNIIPTLGSKVHIHLPPEYLVVITH